MDYRAMNGFRLIASPHMPLFDPDFSACRSPSRARRRFKRGIKGRVKMVISRKLIVDNCNRIIYGHHETLRLLSDNNGTA